MKKLFNFLGNIAASVIAFGLYAVVQQLYFYPQMIIRKTHISSNMMLCLAVLLSLTVLLAEFYVYRYQLKKQNDWHFDQRPHFSSRKLGTAILGVFMLLLASFTLQLALGINAKTTSANQAELNQIAKQAGIFYAPMITLIAPMFEEIIFRGMFFNIFFTHNTSSNKWLGIIANGFLFGYAHDPGLTKFVLIYWTLGCILAWVYLKTRDLRYSMISHILFNSLGFL